MAGARANIRAEISADTTKFQGAMRRAQTVAKATGAKIGQSMAGARAGLNKLASQALKAGAAIGAMAVAIGGAAMVKGLKMAADLGGRLSDIAARTGIAAGEVALLERAFADNGIAASKVGPTINKMQKAIVDATTKGGAMADTFAGLGLDLGKLGAMSPEDQFKAIQGAISSIQDPAQRAAAAMSIFGKSGGEMLTLFADQGALGNAAKSLGTQADILNRRAGTFDSISDILGRVGSKMQGFFVGMLDRIADPVLALLERFDGLDLAAIGQRAGDALKVAVNWSLQLIEDVVYWGETFLHWIKIAGVAIAALFTPSFWASVGYSAQALFMDMGNYAVGFLNGLKDGWIQLVISQFSFWVSVFKEMMKPDFWSGLLDVFKGIAFGFAGFILDAVAKGLELIEKIPGVKRFLGDNSGKLREMAGEFKDKSKESLDDGSDTLSPIFDRIGQKAKEEAAKVGKAFTKGFAKGSETFDSESVKEKAIEAMTPIVDTMADAISDAPARRQISDAVKELLKPAGDAAQKAGEDARRQNDPYYQNNEEEAQVDVKTGLGTAQFKGLDELYEMNKNGPRSFGSKGAALGGDNVFGRDRARLGLASGLQTGGLGEKRKVGTLREEQKQRKDIYAAQQVELLERIERQQAEALTVN
jgi:hypothetical protein